MAFKATFDPQEWVRDYAVSVTPEGPTEWTVSEGNQPTAEAIYATRLIGDLEALDNDDQLKDDPAAPAWVREWDGPFSIYVSME